MAKGNIKNKTQQQRIGKSIFDTIIQLIPGNHDELYVIPNVNKAVDAIISNENYIIEKRKFKRNNF